jgi:hypothetical protein
VPTNTVSGSIAVPLGARIGFGVPDTAGEEPTGPSILVVDGDPNGIEAPKGTLALDPTTPALWQNTDGGTTWGQNSSSTPGPWVPFPLVTQWNDTQGGFAPIAYRLHPDGSLEFRGSADALAGATSLLGTLPSGVWPAYDLEVTVNGYINSFTAAGARLLIGSNGPVRIEKVFGEVDPYESPAVGDNWSLDGIRIPLGV